MQFQVLQHQVGVLQDSAHQNDERYTRAKADNAALQARVIMLEEQLRDAEMRHEERLQVRKIFSRMPDFCYYSSEIYKTKNAFFSFLFFSNVKAFSELFLLFLG